MLFRDKSGKIIEINKKDFIQDADYYNKIALIHGIQFNVPIKPSAMNSILTIIK